VEAIVIHFILFYFILFYFILFYFNFILFYFPLKKIKLFNQTNFHLRNQNMETGQ